MLAQPLQCDDSYEDGCEAEYETEEPQDVDADLRGRRSKCGDSEAQRDNVCSVYAAFKLGEYAQQEYVGGVGRVLLQTLV